MPAISARLLTGVHAPQLSAHIPSSETIEANITGNPI
jgi:hypothetical protein